MSGAVPPRASGSGARLANLIETLELSDFQKQVLRDRWLNQLIWMSDQAGKARAKYQWPRLIVVIGGVTVPALVTILLAAKPGESLGWLFGLSTDAVRFVAFFVSLAVAMLAAAEEVQNYGDRWRHYRRTAETLKTLGWQYVELSGAFRKFTTHAEAFVPFSERVEAALSEDLEGYLAQIATEAGSDRRQNEIIV